MKTMLVVFSLCHFLVVGSNSASAKSSSESLKKSYPGTIKMTFHEVSADKRIKVALFVDDGQESLRALAEVVKLADSKKYPHYVWAWVDCRNNACKPAFTADFPYIFTHTPVGGVARFSSKFDVESFREFEEFRTGAITADKVIRYENEDQIRKLLQEKPVFFKMYEEWCFHSRKMKKAFQAASNGVDRVHLVEVECSKSGGFCTKFGVNSFPVLKLVNKGGLKMHGYSGSREPRDLIGFLKKGSWDFTAEAPKGLSSAQKAANYSAAPLKAKALQNPGLKNK